MASKLKNSFQWNYGQKALIQRLGFDSDTNQYFAETLLDFAEDFTPQKTQALLNSVEIDAHFDYAEIWYNVDYAQAQYFGDDSSWNRSTNYTSIATSGWLEYAWTLYKRSIIGKVSYYSRRHSR